MNRRHAARGQPLVVLSVIMMGWIGARALILEAAPASSGQASLAAAAQPAPGDRQPAKPPASIEQPLQAAPVEAHAQAESRSPAAPPALPRMPAPPARHFMAAPPRPIPSAAPAQPQPDAPAPAALSPRVAAGHQLLWMAALSNLPLPSELSAPPSLRKPDPVGSAAPAPLASRWSGDAWVLYRRDSGSAAQGGFQPSTLGASQAGAVLRYRLDRTDPHRLGFYLRASSALRDPRDEEVALGVSLRPVPQLPVAALVEARVTQLAAGTAVRPAALLVTELPAFDLPAGLRGEVYAQAGYVAGRDETAFADGQIRADRQVARVGRAELRLGGGVWGGAQRGAARLDAGPSATLGLPLGGPAGARLAMDWRFRIAGDTAPRSGPAITLSAGF